MAELGPLSELEQARGALLRAQISFLSTRGSEAAPLLLEAAQRFREVDADLARETYLEALTAAIFAGPLAGPGATSPEVAQAAKGAPPASKPRGLDLLLDSLVALLTDTYAAAVPILRETQRACGYGMSQNEQLRWMWGGAVSAMLLWDDERWERLSDRHLELVRETGALGDLEIALGHRGQMHVFAGELALAASLHEAIEETTELTGSPVAPYHGLGLVAMRGRDAEAKRFIEKARAEVIGRGEGAGLSFADWAEAVLNNGLGHYDEALAASHRVLDRAELVPVNWVILEAIERLSRTRVAVDLARAHLLYGEWLRRERRRADARTELRTAHELFSDFGMEAFAERARIELEATGEHARKRRVETLGDLTPQEAQISRLAAGGHTNREIASQLFISPSTVEYHLRKVFRKLGVKSRTQLANRLGG